MRVGGDGWSCERMNRAGVVVFEQIDGSGVGIESIRLPLNLQTMPSQPL